MIEKLYLLRFIKNYTSYEISEISNVGYRQVQRTLKYLGWNRTLEEAQQLAVKNGRDYNKARQTYKKTMFKKATENNLFGSSVEQYVRYYLNTYLCDSLKGFQVFVGLNNNSLITNEIDIPIIILSENKVFKFAIEVDGFHTHENDKNINKENNIKNNNFILIQIVTKSYFSEKANRIIGTNCLDSQLQECIKIIKNHIENNIFNNQETIILNHKDFKN